MKSTVPAPGPRVLRGGRLARWGARLLALGMLVRDARTPLKAKAVAIGVIVYALSPVDLIPDFVPVLGLLDDLVVLPLGVVLVAHLLPPDLWSEVLERAEARAARYPRRVRWIILGFVAAIVLWLATLAWFAAWLVQAAASSLR